MAYVGRSNFSKHILWGDSFDGGHTYLECTVSGTLNVTINDALTQMTCNVSGLKYTSNTNLDPGGGFWNMFVLGWEMKYFRATHSWGGLTPAESPEATSDTSYWNQFVSDYKNATGQDLKYLFQYSCYDDTPHYENSRTGQTTYTRALTADDFTEDHNIKNLTPLNFAVRQWDESNTQVVNRWSGGVDVKFADLDWSYVPFAVFHGSQFVSCDRDKTAWKEPAHTLITNDLYDSGANNAFVMAGGAWNRAEKIGA